MNPVVRISGEAEVFSSAGRSDLGFIEQVAPSVVSVGVAPELLVPAQHGHRAIGSCILGGGKPIQRVIAESLIPGDVFVVGDAEDIPVVRARGAVAEVKVVGNEKSLAQDAGISRYWWAHAPALKFFNPVFSTDHVRTNIAFHMEVI